MKNGGTQNFHKFAYNEVLYPDPTNLLPAFFNNRVNAIKEAMLGCVQRKYSIVLGNQTMFILVK